MKKGFYILMIMFTALWVVSCDKTKSYTDMLNAERKAIDRLIDENNFEILSGFPKDSIFKPKQYVKLDNGVYLNIINKGTSDRAVLYSTEITARFKVRLFMGGEGDTTTIDNLGPHSNGTYPVEFKYGYGTGLNEYYLNAFICAGLSSALEYVGDSSRVSLIVPFKQMSSDFQTQGTPGFYQEVKFIFKK